MNVRRGERRTPTAADRQHREGDAEAAAYLAEQAPVPAPVEPTTGWDEPAWGSLDYDLAALTPLRGRPCLGCKLERTWPTSPTPTGCASTAATGLTRETTIQGYCALVADRNSGPRATQLLQAAWRRAGRGDRTVIADWVEQHNDLLASDPGD